MGSPNAGVKHHVLVQELREAGFVDISGKGSHQRWVAPDKQETITIPIHRGGDGLGPKAVFLARKAVARYKDRATRYRPLLAGYIDENGVATPKNPIRLEASPTRPLDIQGDDVAMTPETEYAIVTHPRIVKASDPITAGLYVLAVVSPKEWRERQNLRDLMAENLGALKARGAVLLSRKWYATGGISVAQVEFHPDSLTLPPYLTIIYDGPYELPPEPFTMDGVTAKVEPGQGHVLEGGPKEGTGTLRWWWKATRRSHRNKDVWSGLATRSEAEEIILDILLAEAEEEEAEAAEAAAESSAAPPTEEPADPPVGSLVGSPLVSSVPLPPSSSPQEPTVSKNPEIKFVPPEFPYDPATTLLLGEVSTEIRQLAERLDTPETRALTGAAVDPHVVLRRVIALGLERMREGLGARDRESKSA